MNRHRHRLSLVVIVGLALWLPACASYDRSRTRPYDAPAYATTQLDPFWWYHWVGIKAAHDKGATEGEVAIGERVLLGNEDLPKPSGVEVYGKAGRDTGRMGRQPSSRNGRWLKEAPRPRGAFDATLIRTRSWRKRMPWSIGGVGGPSTRRRPVWVDRDRAWRRHDDSGNTSMASVYHRQKQ